MPFPMISFLPKPNFSVSDRKPWTIVRRFDHFSLCAHNSSLEGTIELKFVSFCSSLDALLFTEIKYHSTLPMQKLEGAARQVK